MEMLDQYRDFHGWMKYVRTYGRTGVRLQIMLFNIRMSMYVWHVVDDASKMMKGLNKKPVSGQGKARQKRRP